jgi:molybdopterin converting factor small subunit
MDDQETTATAIVEILFFGKARELLNLSSSQIKLPCSTTKAEIFSSVESSFPELRQLSGCFVLALDQDYLERGSTERVRLSNRSELAVIPPISGG